MAYQPLYATIQDKNTTKNTTSRRGKINWITFWLNSHFGEVMTVNADSEGSLDKKDVYTAEQKIKYWEEKGNTKKVKVWKEKLLERMWKNEEIEKNEDVTININLEYNEKFNFFINGEKYEVKPKKAEEETDSFFDVVTGIAKMGEILCDTKKEKNDWKSRMIKAGFKDKGLSFPEDWDELTEEEKEKRLNKVIEMNGDTK